MYSNKLSQYYNSLMGDYSSITKTVNNLVKSYVSKNTSILELGCGTGNILKSLPKQYDLHGLDNSEGMLTLAQQKMPKVAFYLDDMRTYSLGREFGAILCVFDSINHLPTFSDWEKLFKNTARHLSNDGVFIFDMNTLVRLETLATFERTVLKLDANTIATIKIKKEKKPLYSVTFQFFENIKSKDLEYTEEKVFESSFDLKKVETSLSKYFTVLKKIDPYRESLTDKTGRVFFVCKKK